MSLRLVRAMRRRNARGQMAVAFIVFMALAVLLSSATMNVGEVARLKTSTANATDAGALAGASWVSSGQNQMALIAGAMWDNIVIAQAFLAVPFCQGLIMLLKAEVVAQLLALTIRLLNMWLASVANDTMREAWRMAKADALFKTLDNLWIDDEGDSPARAEIERIRDQFEATRTVPSSVRLEWDRPGADSAAPSWITVDVGFPADSLTPVLQMGDHRLRYFIWTPPIFLIFFCCCWGPPPGRRSFSMWQSVLPIAALATSTATKVLPGRPGKYLGVAWWTIVQPILIATLKPWQGIGLCPGLTCFPWPRSVVTRKPTAIQFGGPGPEIRVTVAQHREDRTVLPFWNISYPDQIVSQASARYSSAKVSWTPDPRSLAQLASVQ